MLRLIAPIALAAFVLILGPAGTVPAQAMCGGNIFMTCPPQAETAKKRERKVREPRRRRGVRTGAAPR